MVSGSRRSACSTIATSPRFSSRRSAPRSSPAGPGSRSSSTRWPAVSRSPSSGAAVREAHFRSRGFPGGGSTSESARAGVDAYSAAIHSASSTRSAGTESSRTEVGAMSRSGASSLSAASPTTTPSSFWWPNGTLTTDPTSTGASGSA